MGKKNKVDSVIAKTGEGSGFETDTVAINLADPAVKIVGFAGSVEDATECTDNCTTKNVDAILVDEKSGIYEVKGDCEITADSIEVPCASEGELNEVLRKEAIAAWYESGLKRGIIPKVCSENTDITHMSLDKLCKRLQKLALAAEKEGKYALAGEFHNLNAAVVNAFNKLDALSQEALNYQPIL